MFCIFNLYFLFVLQLHCCGYNGPEDWDNIPLNNTVDGPLTSCCDFLTYYPTEEICPFNERYQTGCISRLSIIIHRSALYIGTGAVAIALIQVGRFNFAQFQVFNVSQI